MDLPQLPLERLLAALAIGLLVGIERERRKGDGRATAGMRTFAVAALLGALAIHLGGGPLLAVALLSLAAYSIAGYLREKSDDPGLTTETALLAVCLLGALAIGDPPRATAAGVALTVLLAAREGMHAFARKTLSDSEIRDGLLFLVAALLVLPLAPDAPLKWLPFVNPQALWRLVVLVMAIGGAGYIALRAAGPRYGLPLAGFAGGFVSSTLTIGAMAGRVAAAPHLLRGAAAGASLSNVATMLQLAALLAVAGPALLGPLVLPITAAGGAAALAGMLQGWRAVRETGDEVVTPGRAFNPKTAVLFALLVVGMGGVGAWLSARFGGAGLAVAAACAGLMDVHAAAAAVAGLVAAGRIEPEAGGVPVLLALTVNCGSKLIAARSGGRAFFRLTAPVIAAMPVAAWLAWWLVARFAAA